MLVMDIMKKSETSFDFNMIVRFVLVLSKAKNILETSKTVKLVKIGKNKLDSTRVG